MEEKEINIDSSIEENENEAKRTSNFLKKAKSVMNKAKLSRYMGLMAVISATIILSLWQVGWDPNKIGWEKFLANTSLLLFLGCYGLFFGESEGGSFFKNVITGIYQATKELFSEIVDKIVKKSYVDALPDYIAWRYNKDYDNACHMKMLSVRLYDETILSLSDSQLEELRHNPIKTEEGKHYSKVSQEQYQVIKDIREGKIFVDFIDDYNFYLVEDSSDGKQLVTRVKETNKRKEKISWKQRLSRILMIVIVAIILAGFYRELPKENINDIELNEQKLEAIRTLISRISCLLVSIASGINTARLVNLEDVFVLKYKTSYDTVFYCCMENKTFIPIDYQEKAKKEYELYQKEREEALKNLVTPSEDNKPLQIEDKTIYQGGNQNGN